MFNKLSVLTIATKFKDAHISYHLLVSLLFVAEINPCSFLNQVHAGRRPARVWFLEITFVCDVGMCACVCLPRGYKLHSRDI